jgi:hypothetical protein
LHSPQADNVVIFEPEEVAIKEFIFGTFKGILTDEIKAYGDPLYYRIKVPILASKNSTIKKIIYRANPQRAAKYQ